MRVPLSPPPRAGAILLLAALLAAALLRFLIDRGLGEGVSLSWPDGVIRGLRLGAIAAGLVCGGALGISGGLLQATLRNPLADPFILGVSAGAALGVAIATAASWWAGAGSPLLESGGLVLPATLGGLAALLATQVLGTRRAGPDPLTLVLAGVAVSALCGAATLFVQHLLPLALRGDLSTWMLGTLPESPDRMLLAIVAALAVIGLLVAVRLGPTLDALTFGDDEALALGVPLGGVRALLASVAGVLAAGSVAIAGPLAFIGLIAPHLARLLVGPRHALLIVGAAIVGATLLVAADCLRQAIDVGAGRIPIGVFAAFAGAPVFLVLLRSGRGQS